MRRYTLILLAVLITLSAFPTQNFAQQVDEPAPLHLAVVRQNFRLYPDILDNVSREWLEDFAYDLVTLYAPRHPGYSRVYINDQCTLDDTPHNKNNLLRALAYAQGEFERFGYQVKQEIVPGENGAYNLVATKPGSLYPEIAIELGAHIDSVYSSPGASDNASGSAAVLEIARTVQDYPNQYTWRFILFINEEYGLKGSRYHTAQLASQDELLKTALILDGIGWSEIAPEHMNCIWDSGDGETQRIAELFDLARREYQIDIAWRRCAPQWNQVSDNVAYWEQGYPAVLSIGGLPYVDPNYHKCSDTMQKVDLENAYKTTLQNLAVLLILDTENPATNLPQRIKVIETSPTGQPGH